MKKIYWWTEVKNDGNKDIDFLIDLLKKDNKYCYFDISSQNKECVISSYTKNPGSKISYDSDCNSVLLREFFYKDKSEDHCHLDNYIYHTIKLDLNHITNTKEITYSEFNAF